MNFRKFALGYVFLLTMVLSLEVERKTIVTLFTMKA